MSIAYNAALQAATVALCACGYRASRDQHHDRVIHSLRETVGTDPKTVAAFDAFRRKRNTTEYERSGMVSDADAEALQQLAMRLRDEVIGWLRKKHPTLLS